MAPEHKLHDACGISGTAARAGTLLLVVYMGGVHSIGPMSGRPAGLLTPCYSHAAAAAAAASTAAAAAAAAAVAGAGAL